MVHPEVPDAKKLEREANTIIQVVSHHFKIPQDNLFVHQRARDNTLRDIAMYLIRMEPSKPLAEIGELFQMDKYGSVSSWINRVKKRLPDNKQLIQVIGLIRSKLN